MNFVGLKKPADRAAVIEYLRVSDPTPAAQPAAAAAEPVEVVATETPTEQAEPVETPQ